MEIWRQQSKLVLFVVLPSRIKLWLSPPKRSNKISYHSSSSSSNIISAKRNLLTSSTEKDFSNYSESDNEDYATCQLEKKSFCCAGDYYWKEDVTESFTATCSVCNGKCHEQHAWKTKPDFDNGTFSAVQRICHLVTNLPNAILT